MAALRCLGASTAESNRAASSWFGVVQKHFLTPLEFKQQLDTLNTLNPPTCQVDTELPSDKPLKANLGT